ncbi:MAG TPA: DUF3108 domain-containing protein [Gemmatimonadaceae bacterium]|nr:DUF3108 domain-containing protein [Gemmatimonadaceae bacterium]
MMAGRAARWGAGCVFAAVALAAATAAPAPIAAAGIVQAPAQTPIVPPPSPAADPAPRRIPFGLGERADYDVRFGGVGMGKGHMEVLTADVIRGREVIHTRFHIRGGPFFFKVDDRLESWIDPQTMSAMRFRQELNEGSRERERIYEFFPDRATYLEVGKDEEQPSVSAPLDDASFIYFVRTVPLEVGQEYSFNRYFIPDRNPVRVRVLRRERIRVPAGEFDAVVVQPIITTRGLFSENGRAEVWLSDDDRRIILQMKTKFARFTLSLHLKSYRPPTTTLQGPPASP